VKQDIGYRIDILVENKDKLDELQSSFATLKGVYTPFD
jgi:hypothetical protein